MFPDFEWLDLRFPLYFNCYFTIIIINTNLPAQLASALTSLAFIQIEHPGVSAIRRFHMSRLVSGGNGNVNNMTTGSEMFSSPLHKTMYNSTPSSSRPFRKHYR